MIGLGGVCEEACLSINAARIALVDDLVEALRDFGFYPGWTGVPKMAKACRFGGFAILDESK